MLQEIAIKLITVYQNSIRRTLALSCRFVPTCSEYAKQAIVKYGFFKGVFKAVKRLLLCHPFSGRSGYDPLI